MPYYDKSGNSSPGSLTRFGIYDLPKILAIYLNRIYIADSGKKLNLYG
jgi:hypothetical protein